MYHHILLKQRALWALGGILLILTGCFYFVFSARATNAPVAYPSTLTTGYDGVWCPPANSTLSVALQSAPIAFQGPCAEKEKTITQKKLEKDIRMLVAGHPIEAMAPVIARYDRPIAAFLVGIAKKESNWGKRAPSKNGQDCYNYWGYKGAGARGLALGHGCFASPEEAVAVVGKRIATLVHDYDRTTPKEMIIWKCGRSCAGHGKADVAKWISDVELYYDKVVSSG